MAVVGDRRLISALVFLAFSMLTGAVNGAATITFSQIGSNVQATMTGSLDLTGLTNNVAGTPNGRVRGAGPGANVIIGSVVSASADGYTTITGPTTIGTSTTTIDADMGSGGPFGINMAPPSRLLVPQGFVTGGTVSATSTWSNNTVYGLGLTPGSYTYTWPGDTLTINVPAPASIPTLSEWAKIMMVFLMIVTVGWHRLRVKQG